LGQHPEDGSTIAIFEGRYGPYVKYGAVNVTIPKGTTIEEVRLEQVVEWAADKIARDGGVPRRKRAAKPAKNGRPTAAPKRAKSVGSKKKTPPKKKTSGANAKRAKKGKLRKSKSD
jgi:DNA topoisomerase-1